LNAITRRAPSERSAHRFAAYGTSEGRNWWSVPCRGRNATRTPSSVARLISALGEPYGVSTATSSESSRKR
jgi:hypothetical protein